MKRYEKKDIRNGQALKCKTCGRTMSKKAAIADGWIVKGIVSFCPGCPVEE